MKLQIQHRTIYRYAAPASYSIQTLKLTPRREPTQRALAWRLAAPGRRVEQLDAFGNITHLVTIEGPHSEVVVQAEGMVETTEGFDGIIAHDGALSPLVYASPSPLTLANDTIHRLAAEIFAGGAADAARVQQLLVRVGEVVHYQAGATIVTDTASDVVVRGEGVCQDQTHVAIAICRSAGIPARYVSGYILTDGTAQVASHAWIDIWLAAAQHWMSCDVTHGMLAGSRLCRLAVGRDYLDAAPVRGVRRGGGKEQLEVQVIVAGSSGQQ